MRFWSAALIAALFALGVLASSASADTASSACEGAAQQQDASTPPQDPATQDPGTQSADPLTEASSARVADGCGPPPPDCGPVGIGDASSRLPACPPSVPLPLCGIEVKGASRAACPPTVLCGAPEELPPPEIPASASRIALTSCDTCPPPEGVTDPATNVGGGSATLNGHLLSWGGDTHWYFEYGPNPTNFTNSTPVMDVPNGSQTLSAPVSGLPGGTTYYRLVVVGCGATQYGDVLSAGGPRDTAGDASSSAGAATAATLTAVAASSHGATAAIVKQSAPRVATKATKKAKKAKKARKARKARKAKRSKHHG